MKILPQDKYAFVIMPFADSLTSVYRELIQPALKSCGILSVRADEEAQGQIHSQMMHRIFESSIVIADITGKNANVFYELGVAHSCGKKTIVICDYEFINQVPFDIAPYRVFTYSSSLKENVKNDRLKDEIQALSKEIVLVLDEKTEGIPNPVQDYLASQSPVLTTNSLFVKQLDPQSEEELIIHAKNELIYYGITANSFSDLLIGLIETKKRTVPFTINLCLLDPKAQDSWKFLYRLILENMDDTDQIARLQSEDIMIQARAVRRLESLAETKMGMSISVHYYDTPPVFWAYLVDQERLILGHLAMQRVNARHLPVNILVKQDRSSRDLFDYYQTLINLRMQGNV